MARRAIYPRQARPDTVPERGPRPKPGKIKPYPAPNDNPPFRFRPKTPVPFPGRKIPGLPRRIPVPLIPGIGGWPDIGDFIDGWEFYPHPRPFRFPSPWYFHAECGRLPGQPPYCCPHKGARIEFRNGKIHNCATGQVPGGLYYDIEPGQILVPNLASQNTAFVTDVKLDPTRHRHDQTYWRDSDSAGDTSPIAYWPVGASPPGPIPRMPNPNTVRPQPAGSPVPQPSDWAPEPIPAPEPAPPNWQAEFGGRPNPRPQPHLSVPPPAGTKERKVISRAAKVGIWLWQMMDTISELTEIGGAMYDALPKWVRDKYNCGSGVNIGQYGSDLNACMVAALTEYWHLLDTGEAFKNIAKNVVEDMTIGQFHKWLDLVVPPGVSIEKTVGTHLLSKVQAEAYIAGKLDELWEALGI